MKFKLSIFLLITILLISGGYLVWISYGQDIVDKYIITPTPTPDPYAGWKTYTNEAYGFSIKYPRDWYDRGETYGSTYDFNHNFSYEKLSSNPITMSDLIMIQITSRTNNWNSVQDIFNEYNQIPNGTGKTFLPSFGIGQIIVTKLYTFQVQNRTTIKIVVKPAPDSGTEIYESTKYYILNNNKLLSISTDNNDIYTSSQEIAEKMVKSIEFID